MNLKPLALGDLKGIVACLALALAPHLESLPAWVIAAVAVSAALRLELARRGRAAPPRAVRLIVAALAVSLLFLQLRTFNGLSAGTALLALMAGLKLLETDTRRDIYIVTLIIYFVCVSALLQSDSFWLLAYLIGVCWLTSATLLRLTTSLPAPGWPGSLRYAGKLLGQALPLALVFWLFFPRFAGPLWQLPNGGQSAGTGLSDTMSPGDITELAQSDEVAFRVHFAGPVPPSRELYWRGPVMHEFDGHTWKLAYPLSYGAPTLLPQGAAYTYTLSLEPHEHRWVFALDWPSRWDLPRGRLTSDYTLVQPDPVSQPIDVVATSHTRVQSAGTLSAVSRRRDIRLPPDRNPRTLQLARTLRAANPDDSAYVQAVLELFAQQSFYYTLTPPKLSDDSVDEFLFDTKRGFCGHYASAFAALMRAAGIPAHVVTGYYGGTFNRFADYWIVRQSEAHAWDEIWLEGRGWLRIDPTSVIAPERVEHSAGDAAGADDPVAGRWQGHARWLADARLRLDALRQLWRERILLFNQDSQQRLLESFHIPQPDGQKLVLVLTGALVLVLGWLTWTVRRETDPARRDRLSRAYSRLCAKLAAAGIARRAHEGAEDYAARVARVRPDLGSRAAALCRQYSDLRYGAGSSPAAVARFGAEVRAFRPPLKPPGSRASSEI
jgi:transglutaminase-like putative cysteine protease